MKEGSTQPLSDLNARRRITSLASRLVAQGELDQAGRLLATYLKRYGEEVGALRQIANVARLQHRPEDAAGYLERALAVQQDAARNAPPNPVGPEKAGGISQSEGLIAEEIDLILARAESARSKRSYFDIGSTEPDPWPPQAPTPSQHSIESVASSTFDALDDSYAQPATPGPDEQQASNGGVEVTRSGVLDEPPTIEHDEDRRADEKQRHFEEHREVLAALRASEDEAADNEDYTGDDYELLALVDEVDRAEGYSWDDIEDIPDFDESLTREELSIEVDSEGRVSRAERAFVVATELGMRYGWDERGIRLLASVFELHYWSSAKGAMERELEAGMQPEELELAMEVREIWLDVSEFWMSMGRYSHESLSWPVALAAVRAFGSAYPEAEEIRRRMWEAYEEWYGHAFLMRRYLSFYAYLRDCLGLTPQSMVEPAWLTFRWDQEYADVWSSAESQTPGYTTPQVRALADLGLLPARREGLSKPLFEDEED